MTFASNNILLPSTRVNQTEFLVDKAYELVRNAILRNDLKPGDQLSEASLSEQIGISRTPIREALKRLEQEGMIEIVPRRGAFVTGISAEDITEIYQLREALECYAIQFVTEYGDPAELDRLIADFEQSFRWIEAGEIDKVNEADTRLHRYIAHSSRNRRLIETVDQLLSQIVRLRSMTATVPGRLMHQAEEHLQIVHALKTGNVDEAREGLRTHLRSVLQTHLQIRLRLLTEKPREGEAG